MQRSSPNVQQVAPGSDAIELAPHLDAPAGVLVDASHPHNALVRPGLFRSPP